MNKPNWRMIISILVSSFIILAMANYVLGTQSIESAHQYNFNGGLCGDSTLSAEMTEQYNCDSTSGFKAGILFSSLMIMALVVGVTSVLFNVSLKETTLLSFIVILASILLYEIASRALSIPTLSANFMEGRQSLRIGMFEMKSLMIFVYTTIIGLVVSYVGVIIGFIIKISYKTIVR